MRTCTSRGVPASTCVTSCARENGARKIEMSTHSETLHVIPTPFISLHLRINCTCFHADTLPPSPGAFCLTVHVSLGKQYFHYINRHLSLKNWHSSLASINNPMYK